MSARDSLYNLQTRLSSSPASLGNGLARLTAALAILLGSACWRVPSVRAAEQQGSDAPRSAVAALDPSSESQPIQAKPDRPKPDQAKPVKSKADRAEMEQAQPESATNPKSVRPLRPGKADGAKPKSEKRAAANPNSVRHEAAALAFAREHHAELAELIATLKSSSLPEYEQAVRELYRVRERLFQLQKREPERHALELELWKTKSRMRLMAARLSLGEEARSEKHQGENHPTSLQLVEEQFKEAFRRRSEIQRELLELEQRQLQARLVEVNAALERGRQRPKSRADVDVQKALEKIRQSRPRLPTTGPGIVQAPETPM